MKDYVVIKTVNVLYEAEIIKGFLEANGVRAELNVNDDSFTSPYPFSYVNGIKIYVSAKDATTASELLKERK